MKKFSTFLEEKDTHKTKDGRTAKKGLWYNIHQKRKRGEKPAKPGDKDYPKTLDIDEVLDTPKAMDSYKKKAKMQSDKARNSATAKIVRGNDDISKEKNIIRKREKGQNMADRASVRHFRKQMGYNKK